MLLIGIVAGAFIGGFLSSETITYYNYTQVVASFQPYSGFDDANSSSSYVIVPAVDENGKGVATMMEVQIVPGERRALVDIDKLLFWTDTQNSIRVSRSVAENVTGIDLSYYDIMYSIKANASVIEGPSAGAAMTIATIAALENREIDHGIMLTGTINHDGTIGPVGEILAKAMAAKEIGADLFIVPLGQSHQVVYDSIEHCEILALGKMCSIERVPRQISISEETGVEVVEVKDIWEVMGYFFREKPEENG